MANIDNPGLINLQQNYTTGLKPHKCPVCEGIGKVSPGFYDYYNKYSSTNAARETCRSCNGKGYIVT